MLRPLFFCSKKKSYFVFQLFIVNQFKGVSEEIGFSRLLGSQGVIS